MYNNNKVLISSQNSFKRNAIEKEFLIFEGYINDFNDMNRKKNNKITKKKK